MNDFFISTLLLGIALLPLSLGVYLSLKVYQVPDITTDGSYVLGACSGAVLIESGISPLLVIPVILLAGFCSGIITGIIHTKIKVNALLSGIIVMTGLFSVNLAILGKPNLSLIQHEGLFGDPSILTDNLKAVALLIGICLTIYLLFYYLLRTDYGLSMRATGSNEDMAKNYGINTSANKITGLGFANALSAMSGFLMLQIQGFSDVNMGIGIVIAGLASVMIADKLIPQKNNYSLVIELSMLIVGTLIYRFIISLAIFSGIPSTYIKLLTSVLVLMVLLVPSKRNFFSNGR